MAKTTEIAPTASSTAPGFTNAASENPSPTPSAALGSSTSRTRLSQVLRKLQTLTTSCTIRIGKVIEAASTGETLSAINGTAITPMPENPPLARPSRITAGIATA